MTSPHILWLKHGLHTQTALVAVSWLAVSHSRETYGRGTRACPMVTSWRTTAIAKQSDRRKNIWKLS